MVAKSTITMAHCAVLSWLHWVRSLLLSPSSTLSNWENPVDLKMRCMSFQFFFKCKIMLIKRKKKKQSSKGIIYQKLQLQLFCSWLCTKSWWIHWQCHWNARKGIWHSTEQCPMNRRFRTASATFILSPFKNTDWAWGNISTFDRWNNGNSELLILH